MFDRRILLAVVPAAACAFADTQPHGGMLRYPDVSATHVVFVYGNDLWLAPREGGSAVPLASPPGSELFPRFSPDGKSIAFVGNYDGNRDLYTMPVSGGVPTRVTYHPTAETLCDWTPDGKQLLFSCGGRAEYPRTIELFTIAATGGPVENLPVPYGANASLSADNKLAYTPHSHDHRTWKRYRGGMATDIWVFDLNTSKSQKVTSWEGTDSQPMWHKGKVYYMSDDGPSHRLNIWRVDPASGQRDQLTKYDDYDIKWPSIGPGPSGQGEIVFQHGPELVLLDLAGGATRAVQITIPGDRPTLRPQTVDAAEMIQSADISPTGKRALVSARGDVWSIPAKDGSARNHSQTAGFAERDPAWSPDGKQIAYLSDASGEYELYVMPAEGGGEPKRISNCSGRWPGGLSWSPDSKRIAYNDNTGAMFLHTFETNETIQFDVEPWAAPSRVSWSHDSNWIAYTKGGENLQSSIWLYDVPGKQAHQVTRGMFPDGWPTFDRKGEFLYFTSNREFSSPVYEDIGTTFVYAGTERLVAVPLRKDVKSPLLPKSDEEGGDETDKDKSKDGATSAPASSSAPASASAPASDSQPASSSAPASQPAEPLKIDLAGFEQRAILLPMKRGNFAFLAVNNDGHLLYVRQVARGSDGDPAIKIVDLASDEREEKTVVSGPGTFQISADGKKLLAIKDPKTAAIIDAKSDQKLDKPISVADLNVTVDPRAEWRQIFLDAWRIEREFFYVANLHGVDWDAIRKQYERMLDECTSRDDLSYVIREMISELNVGHAYYSGGDNEKEPSRNVGMLGCDFELADGAWRIKAILGGGDWDLDARGPLSESGVDAKPGDFLLAVNGRPLDPSKEPYAAFVGLADRVVQLTLSDKPRNDETARRVVVKLLSGEGGLRYRAWVERNRAYVAEKSDGKVGYIYVPSTGIDGQNELFRQFYGQLDKAALIIDERWNGGGQIPTRFIELLNRPMVSYWARRHGHDWPWPPDAHPGPKCMMINGLAGSGGDAFPAFFRQRGLGKLIGTRTWGGLVGISGNPPLIDGGSVTAPTFGYYEMDGTWGIEGHGVDPDIEVVDDPALMVGGKDPQLDAAIAHMLEEIRTHGYQKPKRPADPDRRGMGIRPEDK